MYLIFEGVDTSGKTTQIELLKTQLSDAIFTKEPGGTELGVKLREIILHSGVKSKKAELLLFLADRAEHYERVIKPNKDKIIISDRGLISGIAYAKANGDKNIEFLCDLNRFVLDDNMPNLVILMWTNEEIIKKRLSNKQEDAIEARGIKYLLRVQENMKEILDILNINYRVIDSSKSIEEINKEIRGFIDD